MTLDEARRVMLEATALTAPDERLRRVATRIARAGLPSGAGGGGGGVGAGAIVYRIGVTGVQTPAPWPCTWGRGCARTSPTSCSASCACWTCRPATSRGTSPGDGVPHAWAEAILEDRDATGGATAVAYDPTHRRRAGLEYITIAVGRDFADVTPTSGTFRRWGHRAPQRVQAGGGGGAGGGLGGGPGRGGARDHPRRPQTP